MSCSSGTPWTMAAERKPSAPDVLQILDREGKVHSDREPKLSP